MRTWEIRYKLQKVGGKYFFRRVDAVYQHEANKIFDNEMPNAYRCGSARAVKWQGDKNGIKTVISGNKG